MFYTFTNGCLNLLKYTVRLKLYSQIITAKKKVEKKKEILNECRILRHRSTILIFLSIDCLYSYNRRSRIAIS